MKNIIVVSLFLFTIQSVLADCEYDLDVPSLLYTLANNSVTIPKTVTLTRNKNSSNCGNFFLGFTRGWSSTYNRYATNLANGDKINYNLYKNSGATQVLKNPSDISSDNDVILGTIAKNETKTFTYYFSINPYSSAAMPKSGTYIDYVQVQAYSGFWSAIVAYEGYRNLYVQIYVPKLVSLSLVDTGGAFNPTDTTHVLDFGELEQNEELSFDLIIQSNSGYNVTLSSLNSGVLKNTTAATGNNTVGYDLYVNNVVKSLMSPNVVASSTNSTPSGGNRIPIKVKIKAVDNKEPGTYTDYVTVTTTAL